MITVKQKGSYTKTRRYLSKAKKIKFNNILAKYGQIGVDALAGVTPIDSGETAASWVYKINETSRGYELIWSNTHRNGGAVIALLIQYGHGTGSGGYVPPRDFINPAMKSVFDTLSERLWKEVSRL